jgi:dynein heavy chain 2
MSELHLVSSWSSVIPSARLPVRVCGLHLEGATFKSSSLAAASPDSPSLELLPACILAWVPKVRLFKY